MGLFLRKLFLGVLVRRRTGGLEVFDDLAFQRPQLAQRLLDIDKLDLQRGDPLSPMDQREAHLLDLPVIDIVEIEEILDLPEQPPQSVLV